MCPRMTCAPLAAAELRTGRVVVEDQLDVELGGDLLVDRLQKLLDLDRTMAGVQRADHLARGRVEGGEEAGDAGAPVVVACPFGRAREYRQGRLGANRAPGSGTSHPRRAPERARAVEVEADDVADLLCEQRVGGELEGLGAMRLQPEGAPDPRDRGMGEADLARHRARRPVGRVLWY